MRTSIAIPILVAAGAQAWGTVGHATVATIADNYLTAETKTWVSNILGNGVAMSSVASWADTFRYSKGGRFSAPFHFIDAEDSPPTSCSVDLNRDCGKGGCIVSAIQNYTQIVTQSQDVEALKFLIHFLGDITQPLHDEAEAVGGNSIKVTWNGAATNLHHCWDTQMVEEAAGGSSATVISSFATTLIGSIESGQYASQKDSWVSCVDPTKTEDCAIEWAQDANAINCQFVLVNDETNQELNGDYYAGAVPFIEQQIAKGGYRLGAWLNAVAAQSNSGSS